MLVPASRITVLFWCPCLLASYNWPDDGAPGCKVVHRTPRWAIDNDKVLSNFTDVATPIHLLGSFLLAWTASHCTCLYAVLRPYHLPFCVCALYSLHTSCKSYMARLILHRTAQCQHSAAPISAKCTLHGARYLKML